jgi:SAM-dependent methyltransferase
MNTEDEQRIASYYDHLVDRYGYDPRAVDASSQEALQIRYRVISNVLDLAGKRVLEVGCGFGDLGAFLEGRYEDIVYCGIDISSRMIAEGRRIHPELDLREINVLELDLTESFDVVVAQGIFYLLGTEAEAKMHELITKMFALAKEAVAFTTTSSWSDRRATDEFYADPIRLVSFVRSLTRSIALRHDYHPGDFAMYLYKRGQGAL